MPDKRRIAAAVLCACFVLRLTCGAVSRDGLYFVAVENAVAPLTEETMPFWHDGYLYISSEVFTGAVRDASGISRAKIGDGVLLHRGGESLLFRNDYPYAQGSQEETYAPGMVWHEGSAYVPAAVVARYFNLTYSAVNVPHGKLVWLRSASFTMDDKAFAKAAQFQMNAAYQEYLRSLEPEPDATETDTEPEEPDASEEAQADASETPTNPMTPETPATTKPVTPETPATTKPVTPEKPATTKPVTPETPATTKPVTPETPATTKPVTPETPATTKPVTPETPATTKPVTPETPATTKPVTPETPATTKPVTPETPATTKPVTPETPAATPDNAATTPADSAPEIVGGQRIYLCLRGGDATSALLDALDRHSILAAVFCDEAFLSAQGDLLRRMAATGHKIGLYVEADSAASALERVEACNEQLRRVTMEKTRMVYADGAGEETLRALQDAGFLCLRPTLDRARFPLRTSRQAANLLQAVSQESETVILWLGGDANRSGLNSFLTEAFKISDAFPTLTEPVLS